MDMKIELGGRDAGTIRYDSLPAFYYVFRELGFQVHIDSKNQKVQLKSGLAGKQIWISADHDSRQEAFRKAKLERTVLEHIKNFLTSCGAEVLLNGEMGYAEKTDLHLKLALYEIPSIKEPILELTYNISQDDKKWVEHFQNECRLAGTKFRVNEVTTNGNSSIMKIHIMYPEIMEDLFWNKFGENHAMIITTGILSRLIGSSTLSIFSLVPLELFQIHEAPTEKNKKNDVAEKQRQEKILETKKEEAEVFFDYHLFVDADDGIKIKIFGNLHIKNSGTEILRNPVICIRSTPLESIKITGQILPPNVTKTLGVMNNDGAKGWKFMNDNWIEEAEEKGETWICPIQSLNILPGEMESISNLQISVLKLAEKNIRVEAFVYFIEQGLEFHANNKISLMLSQKKKQ